MRIVIARIPADIPGGVPTLGIEIPGNRSDLIARCSLGNIDPQHGGDTFGVTDQSAAYAVLVAAHLDPFHGGGETPHERLRKTLLSIPDEIAYVVTRPDLDAFAAMALAGMFREIATPATPRAMMTERVRAIDASDRFTAGVWPGPRPLPTPAAPWTQTGGCGEVEALAAVNRVCGWVTPQGGNRLTPEQAVMVVGHWLLHGDPDPSIVSEMRDVAHSREVAKYGPDAWAYAIKSEGVARPMRLLALATLEAWDARVVVARALQDGTLDMRAVWVQDKQITGMTSVGALRAGTPIPVVFTDLRGSKLPTDSTAGLAYCLAPVSVLAWRRNGLDGFTVVAFDDNRLDFPALRAEFNELEPGWTPPHIPGRTCSSPQNRSTTLAVNVVLAAVARHLK